jgi:hypothetical protein
VCEHPIAKNSTNTNGHLPHRSPPFLVVTITDEPAAAELIKLPIARFWLTANGSLTAHDVSGIEHSMAHSLSLDDLLAHPRRAMALLRSQDLALMDKGRPIAVLIRVENGDVDDVLRFVRRVRTEAAVARMRGKAKKTGASRMSLTAINAEIRAARRQRKSA